MAGGQVDPAFLPTRMPTRRSGKPRIPRTAIAPGDTLETGPHHTDLPDVTRPADPRPTPPEKPLPTDCCGSGCAVCVNDAYQEELDDYEARLAAWRVRNPGLDAADRRITGD